MVAQYKILTTSRVPVKLTQQGKRFTIEGRTKILFEDFAITIPPCFSFAQASIQR